MHPNKVKKGEEIDFYDIKGGGEVADMSPHILLVDRNFDKEMTKVKVLKVKFNHLGENNKHVWLKWNESNGRYIDFSNQNDDAELTSLPIYDNKNWLDENYTQPTLEFNHSQIIPAINFYDTKETKIIDASGNEMPF
jgi:hypothetical protein